MPLALKSINGEEIVCCVPAANAFLDAKRNVAVPPWALQVGLVCAPVLLLHKLIFPKPAHPVGGKAAPSTPSVLSSD